MAKSLPRVRPGILDRSANLLEANIAMYLVDQILKGDDEPIAVSDLVALTKEPRERVINVLQEMSYVGKLERPSGMLWAEVDAFHLASIRIGTKLAVRDKSEDGNDGPYVKGGLFGDLPAPVLTEEQKRDQKRRSGWDEIDVRGRRYRADVLPIHQGGESDGLLYWQLKGRVYTIGAEFEDEQTIDVPEQHASLEAAWAEWDAYMAPIISDGETFCQWMDRVIRDYRRSELRELTITPATFEHYVRELYAGDDEAIADILETGRAEEPDEFLIRRATDDDIRSGQPMHSWPGMLLPDVRWHNTSSEGADYDPFGDPEEEEAADAPSVSWGYEDEEGVKAPREGGEQEEEGQEEKTPEDMKFIVGKAKKSQVVVTIRHMGRDHFRATFSGPVSESGEVVCNLVGDRNWQVYARDEAERLVSSFRSPEVAK